MEFKCVNGKNGFKYEIVPSVTMYKFVEQNYYTFLLPSIIWRYIKYSLNFDKEGNLGFFSIQM